MNIFVIERIEEIEGKLHFYKLRINGICEFDRFWTKCELDGNLNGELHTIQARMQQLAELKTLPNEKHKDITPKNELVKEYEIKTKHIRVYTIHDKEYGRLIILGGKKVNQKKDINKFRNIKKVYLKSRGK